MAVSISLADDIDISRGDMLARPQNQPVATQEFDATVCWMADQSSLEPGRDYIIKQTTRTTRARVSGLDYRLDVNTLHRDKSATALKLNELGRVTLRTQVPLLLDEYSRNAATGSFILIDPDTNVTVAAGMVRDTAPTATRASSPNTVRHQSLVSAGDRLTKGRTLWFTGLSGSGKSSIAVLVEQKLLEHGCPAYILDGDNLRHGLNADLGFSMADRAENLRRLAHIATLMADAGLTILVPAISRSRSIGNLPARSMPTRESSSSRYSSTPRSRTASVVTPRGGCMPRRGPVRSPTSPGSTARTSARRTLIYD